MSKNRYRWLWGIAAAAFFAAIVAGSAFFRNYYNNKVNEERTAQLGELVNQVGTNFISTLDSSWDFVNSAKNLAERYTYESSESIVEMADWLDRITELRDKDGFFLLLDDKGYCYDASGRRGVWTDLDQVGTQEQCTFISDSTLYDGYYWAFVQKLSEEIELQDESGSVCYVVLMRKTTSLESSFANSAYREVGETYILKENGTRMYDNLDEEDTLEAYNVFAALRETTSSFGRDFSEAELELEENVSVSGDCVYEGTEYCYSLYHIEKYKMILLFWLPAAAIATNTLEMVSSLITFLLGAAVLIALSMTTALVIFMRGRSRNRLLEQQERSNEELRKSNQSLEEAQKVTEQALAVAQSANRAKSSFLSNMSHDIRTPLNAILGFLKLLDASASDPEKVREYSGKIAMAGNHLLALINDILDMSRIESGKTTLNPEPFELEELVVDLQTLMAPQTQARRQTFRVENQAGSLSLLGDRARLNQILTNLLSNAVKYTPEGGEIEFKTQRLPGKGNQAALIRFVVRDNGVGMGEEFQQRIFEPFSREESVTVNGISGTGLGMSITKNLVDLMGGIILVESRRGEGSTFTVELSFRLAESSVQTETVQWASELTGILKGLHFLMAEDNEINAEILTDLLEMEGATCDVAPNGQEAVSLFETSDPGKYDAILMDVQMPVMDGYEATRQIRHSAHPEARSIPIAALTANAFAEDVQKALEAGMNTHIAKPVDMEKLREFVASI